MYTVYNACDLCGSKENLVFGYDTLFDEYDMICENCLKEAMLFETSSPFEYSK